MKSLSTKDLEEKSALLEQEAMDASISSLPDRLERYSVAKRRGREMAHFVASIPGAVGAPERKHRASKLSTCGSYLVFRHFYLRDEVRLAAACFCQQDKLCPLCAIRRGSKMLRKLTDRVVSVVGANPGLSAHLVTFTVKNGEDLSERYNHLQKSLHELIHRRQYVRLGRLPWSEASVAIGGISAIEVKRGENSGGWHPHAHCVWLCDVSPDQEALRQEWRDITGDSHMVDARPFNFTAHNLPATPENVAPDFLEVCKYALKFSTMDFADNWHAACVLHRRRLVSSFGALFACDLIPDLLDEPVDYGDEPYVEMMFKFFDGCYTGTSIE